MNILLAAVMVLCLQVAQSVECPASHFDFLGRYSIGKQDELNRTFANIQDKITALANVSFNASETTSYTIFNARPVFYYRDSQQKADVLGDDIIVIYGGKLQVSLVFEWSKKSLITMNGTGSALGLSDMITFAKTAVIQNGSFYSYELLNAQKITWSTQESFKLNRVDPATVTEDDKAALTRLLNSVPGTQAVSQVLEEEIDKIYSYYLRASLHDEHMPINNHFDYVWVRGGGKPNVTIPFSRRPLTIDLQRAGVQLTFDVQSEGYTGWDCGNRPVPSSPLKPDIYGSTQQFVSLDFYKNVLRYAISKNILDADLTRQNWGSRMFQFYAGDLYEVLDKVQDKYFAAEPVSGNCKPTFAGLNVWKSGYDTFNVSIYFDCELSIQRTKLLDLGVGIELEVEGIPTATTLDFKFRRHEQHVTFRPNADYKILEQDLGRAMIKHSLNRLYEGVLFGSGWPMSPPRDYPQMQVEQNYTIVYDSTHVDPHLVQL